LEKNNTCLSDTRLIIIEFVNLKKIPDAEKVLALRHLESLKMTVEEYNLQYRLKRQQDCENDRIIENEFENVVMNA